HTRRVVWIVQFQHIPAHVALHAVRHALLEKLPLEPELALVAAYFVGVVDAVEREFPVVAGAEEGILDRDAVADFPAETLCRFCSGDRAGAIFYKIVPLIIRNAELGKNLALIFDVDRELREEILLVLVDAAEPVVVRERFYAGNAQDLVLIRN